MNELNFLKGTKENYDKLTQIDENAFYITQADNKNEEIRLGSSVWSNDEIIINYIDEQIGDINKVLEYILGENN